MNLDKLSLNQLQMLELMLAQPGDASDLIARAELQLARWQVIEALRQAQLDERVIDALQKRHG